jgi:trans-feruloyl-CoA hydratase/vanillin synthase
LQPKKLIGLSEINWGILRKRPVARTLPCKADLRNDGRNVDGRPRWGACKKPCRWTLQARGRCWYLLEKPVALKFTKDAIRRVGEMTYDNAEDYLIRAQEAANSYDNEGRKEGIKQFIDDKTYKPGLGAYDKSKQGRKEK